MKKMVGIMSSPHRSDQCRQKIAVLSGPGTGQYAANSQVMPPTSGPEIPDSAGEAVETSTSSTAEFEKHDKQQTCCRRHPALGSPSLLGKRKKSKREVNT